MGRTIKTAYVETEVDVDLDDIETDDIVEYLEEKGFTVMEVNHSAYDNFADIDKRIWALYLVYTSASSDMEMHKALGSFFADYYNKVSV
jgi:hypothetical protein